MLYCCYTLVALVRDETSSRVLTSVRYRTRVLYSPEPVSRSTGICGVPSGVHVPKGNAVKMIDLEPRFFDIISASCNS